MTSWWKLIAQEAGHAQASTGSWERRYAVGEGAGDQPGHTWPKKVAREVGVTRDQGSWTKRLVEEDDLADGSAARSLLEVEEGGGGPGPDAPPTITSSNSASVAENDTLSKVLTASEAVTWSITGGADAAQFEISGSTLRWVSNGTKDFEDPDDANADNAYVVVVRATDSAAQTADQTITVTVTDVEEFTEQQLMLAGVYVNTKTAHQRMLFNGYYLSEG